MLGKEPNTKVVMDSNTNLRNISKGNSFIPATICVEIGNKYSTTKI